MMTRIRNIRRWLLLLNNIIGKLIRYEKHVHHRSLHGSCTSLLCLWGGAGIDTTKVFFSEILQQHGYQTGVVGKWHMQCEPKGAGAAINSNELYDLLNDPNEVNNLYGNPEYNEVTTRLQKQLDSFRLEQKVDEY